MTQEKHMLDKLCEENNVTRSADCVISTEVIRAQQMQQFGLIDLNDEKRRFQCFASGDTICGSGK